MIIQAWLAENFLSWLAQVFVVGAVGALLPLVFRIRHPRSLLAYSHVLLIGTLLLPIIQPWHHPIAIQSGAQPAATQVMNPNVAPRHAVESMEDTHWPQLLLWIFLLGVAAKVCWLAFGLWQILKLQIEATPLAAVPQSIRSARAMVKTGALFCVSGKVGGPVTFGFLRPIVLLPETFIQLSEEAQCGIACHELLHVRRKDWLIAILEEIAGAVLWFHPGIWFVFAQARLAREQLVDAEVIRITAAREPYVQALLTMAGVSHVTDLLPASSFLRRRQLVKRMHSLFAEVPMSKIRLFCSYGSMAAVLAVCGWCVAMFFPMVGAAQVQAAQNSPGYVVNRAPISYPTDAIQKRIEGTVVVELTFNEKGTVIDSRVLSGPEELRQSALQTALQGSYAISVARTLQVVVDYKLPAAGQRGTAAQTRNPATASGPTSTVAQISGTIMDGSRNLIPGAMIRLTNTTSGTASIVVSNERGAYRLPSVAPGTYRLSAELPGFQTVTYNLPVLAASQQVQLNFTLQPNVGTSVPTQVPDTPAVAPPSSPPRVRVGGNVMAAMLQARVDPVYPQQAKDAQIQGVVVLEAEINKEGHVTNLRVVTGHPFLIQAAMDAVKQWTYKPVMLNGEPVDVVSTVTINFTRPD